MTELAGWENFYVIVGGSAGALIGLQFVALSLIANQPLARANAQTGGTFSTPTIIHFSAVLALSAILSAPWDGITAPGYVYGVMGCAGVIYSAGVAWRIRRQTAYKPEFEDWLFHVILPLVAYGILVACAIATRQRSREALFGVGGAALLLLLIGIHNTWDAVLYHVFTRRQDQPPPA